MELFALRRKLISRQSTNSEENLSKKLTTIFTNKQIAILLKGQNHGKWTNEDIGRAISLRYKANTYEHLREMGFPFPSTRTLRRWTSGIQFNQGLLFPVLNLLKQQFEYAPEIQRQCVLSFDEMSLDSRIEYDPFEDKVYGPKSSMNVYFVRGLFGRWKQAIAYEFDDDFSSVKFMNLVEVLEKIGLRVRATVNDLGGKNRKLTNSLGVMVRKSIATEEQYKITSSVSNPVSGESIWFFADAPHLIKLLRNNLLTHGLTIKGGFQLKKSDFDHMLTVDKSELKMNFKLTRKHLNVDGKEKQRVYLAVQLFSTTTAAVWKTIYPNKTAQGNFIQLVNDYFDLMNSRNPQETLFTKQPFGTDFLAQNAILNRMEEAMTNMRVGSSNTLYPFQRGFLYSIHSMRGLFHDLSGHSMRINFILTHRLNQDLAENAFSVIRKTGAYNDSPSPVDAKRRLKLMMLSWSGQNLKNCPVQAEDDQPFLTGTMIKSLIECAQSEIQCEPQQPVFLPDADFEVNEFREDDFTEVMLAMGFSERCEQGGKEYLAGFVASKLRSSNPELAATVIEIDQVKTTSWVSALSKGNLVVPSIRWRNDCELLHQEFEQFHDNRDKLNRNTGVLKGFCEALGNRYPLISKSALQKYIKVRLFIRIKHLNRKMEEKRAEDRKKQQERFKKRQEWLILHSNKSNVTYESLNSVDEQRDLEDDESEDTTECVSIEATGELFSSLQEYLHDEI